MKLNDQRRLGRRLALLSTSAGRNLTAGVETRLILAERRRRSSVPAALTADERVRAAGQRVAQTGVPDGSEAPETAGVFVVPRDARQPAQSVLEPAAEPVGTNVTRSLNAATKQKKSFLQLHKSLIVHSCLISNTVYRGRPYYHKGIHLLEKVQKELQG